MKAIAAILRSYLHRRVFVLMLILAAIYCLTAAIALVKQHPKAAWCFFLYVFAFMSAAAGFHLRQMAEGNAADLLPNYRQYQLVTAGTILAVFLIWPVLFTSLTGVSVWITLAAFLFFACLALWIAFFLENGLIVFAGVVIIWWLAVDIYSLATHSPDVSRIGKLAGFVGVSWPIYVIAASALGLSIFAFYFLSFAHFPEESRNDYKIALETQDWTDPAAVKLAAKTISRLAEKKAGSSRYRLAHLYQFSLFSPIYTAPVYYVFFGSFIFCALITYLSFHQQTERDFPLMSFYLPFAYYWMTAALASDFLSHQNRMPFIYLQSPLSSINAFRTTVALSYLLTVGRHMLSTTMAMVVLHSLFPWTTWKHLFPLCVMGIILSVIQFSLSLLASRKIATPARSMGWLIINMCSVFPLVLFAKFYSHIWMFVAMVIGGLLFWLAMRRWSRTELDFVMN